MEEIVSEWKKASGCHANGTCVEARSWRKSSKSGSNMCVEVASAPHNGIDVRDSKNPDMPFISVAPSTFGILLNALR